MNKFSPQTQKHLSDLFQQGQRAMQLGQFSRAEKCLLDILKIAPGAIEANNSLAFVYAASKQHDKALEQFKLVLAANPKHAHTHHNIANSLYGLGAYEEAISHFQTAHSIDSKLTDSLIHCGMAYHKLGQTDVAIAFLHRALDQDTRSAYAFHILGKLHGDIGDYERALDYLQNASKLAPENIIFKLELARTLDKADLLEEAALLYHQTCEENPNLLEAFEAYAALLHKCHRYDEALECANRAKQIAPENPVVEEQLADIYLGMGNTEEALKYYNKALLHNPDKLSILKGIGTAYLEIGLLTDATTIADKMIVISNQSLDGYLLKSRVKKSIKGDGLAEELLKLSTLEKLSEDNKVLVHYALGKTFDEQKNYTDAFTHFKIANDIKKARSPYDRAIAENHFKEMINLFTPDFLRSHKNFGTERDLPILIVGMPRSGTTLTEQILSSHPDILGAGEVTFWGAANNAIPLKMHTSTPYPQCLHEMSIELAHDIAELYENTLRKTVGAGTTSKHITDKMPHNFLQLGLILTLFPNVKIIHTKRDPIDTCLSIYFQHFNDSHSYAADLGDLVFYYKQYERLMQHWHAVLPGRILDVNYEDTISDPEYWSRQLISHIGLEWSESCLAPQKLERAVKTISQWQVRQPIYKTSVQRWKNYEPFISPLIEGLA